MIEYPVFVLTCTCGTVPLADAAHGTAQGCWNAAAKHVALNARCAATVRTSKTYSPVPVA